MAFSLKRFLIGQPLSTERAHEERLPKVLALPIFASDALSSTAYASEEIMAALLVAGASWFYLTPGISLAISLLLAIVVISYWQIVMAYPGGGGAYVVARENLGELPAQTAGAALLVDYVLTVAVSVSAGVAAITSLLKTYGYDISEHIVPLCLLCVLLLTIVNLRGVRESGAAFALPTYTFIAVMYTLIGYGLYQLMTRGGLPQVFSERDFYGAFIGSAHGGESHAALQALPPLLLLRAFASGCTALTGTEAISNGVTAFKEPSSKNAAATMVWMGLILGSVFLGLSYLAVQVRALPEIAVLPGAGEHLGETVVSQVGRMVFGTGPLYLVLQIATCLILVLAANTSFAGFPRLCAIQARDGFMPRQLTNIGDKLVFNNGIVGLAVLSALLIVVFRGSTHLLIPLYAVGVFLSFTLSQAGMVKRWLRLRTPGWRIKAAINGFGALATCVVMIVFGVVKFTHGAWFVVILIPALIFVFFRIHRHYRSVSKQLSLEGYRPAQGLRHHVLVLAPDIHRGVIPALQYARAISEDARGVHVSIDPSREARLRARWQRWSRGIPLVILPSPYRSLNDPITHYIDRLQAQEPRSLITVVIPEFVPTGWWAKSLHGQAGLALKLRLLFKRGVVVTSVPYHIEAYVDLPPAEKPARDGAVGDGTPSGLVAFAPAQVPLASAAGNGAAAPATVSGTGNGISPQTSDSDENRNGARATASGEPARAKRVLNGAALGRQPTAAPGGQPTAPTDDAAAGAGTSEKP